MPIAASSEQNDARGSAWLLAHMAKDFLEHPQPVASGAPVVSNMQRLLEAYRAHGFYGFDYRPRADTQAEAFSLLPPAERRVRDVKEALDTAFAAAYGSNKDASLKVTGVLNSMAKADLEAYSNQDRQKVIEFLEKFIDALGVS